MSSRNRLALAWSAAATKTLNSNNAMVWSDAIEVNTGLSTETWEVDLQVKADNQGTAQAGDVVDLYVSYSHDNSLWDSDGHAQSLGRLDTYVEDPCVLSVPLRSTARSFKIGTKGGAAVATRNIVVSGSVMDHRSA